VRVVLCGRILTALSQEPSREALELPGGSSSPFAWPRGWAELVSASRAFIVTVMLRLTYLNVFAICFDHYS
jgi:hypothetical protein